MAGLERAIPPPIGAEATQEAGGDEAHRASLVRRRKEVEETLARNAADVRRLARTTAVLGTEIVGGDVYARAGELTMLIMTGERPVSELVESILGHCSSLAPTPSSPRRRPPDGFLGLTTLTTSKVGCHCRFVKRSTSRV